MLRGGIEPHSAQAELSRRSDVVEGETRGMRTPGTALCAAVGAVEEQCAQRGGRGPRALPGGSGRRLKKPVGKDGALRSGEKASIAINADQRTHEG